MSEPGFLHLKDLIKIQALDPIFTIPEKPDDISKKMENQIADEKGVAFDLRLGSQYYLSGAKSPNKLKEGESVVIEPGQFALLTTYEIFHMPVDMMAFISMRFRFKAEGLINVSGFQVDPGYQGIFIFAVYNAGPLQVPLRFKDTIFTIIFAKTSQPIKEKRGPINEIDREKYTKLMQTSHISLVALDQRISKLENWKKSIYYWIPVTVGIGIGVATLIFELVLYSLSHGGSHT